jgi:hypothetical protein
MGDNQVACVDMASGESEAFVLGWHSYHHNRPTI